MITELRKRCQEMARIEDFASFKSELLGPPDPSPNFLFASLLSPKSLVTAMAFCRWYQKILSEILETFLQFLFLSLDVI
jgi:hypothetical protein